MHILDQLVNERHLLNHPFYQRWMAGTLTFKELQRYVANYYPYVSAFPTNGDSHLKSLLIGHEVIVPIFSDMIDRV